MTNYQKAELAGRIKVALLQAITAIELQDGPLFDKYIALVARLFIDRMKSDEAFSKRVMGIEDVAGRL